MQLLECREVGRSRHITQKIWVNGIINQDKGKYYWYDYYGKGEYAADFRTEDCSVTTVLR